MPPQVPATGGAERPATLEEIISAIAKQHQVAPALALAVARKESGLDLNAIGDAGKAVGLFQMHSGAAQDAGITDRNDPFQNITGGIRYLKQLNDRYQGDVMKTLQAYNGGLDNVDKGIVSPQAQAYASDVLAQLSRGFRQSTTPGGGQAQPSLTVERPAPGWKSTAEREGIVQPGQPAQAGVVESLKQSVNPFTFEGRVNLTATGAGIAAGLATRNPQIGVAARAGIITAAQTAARTGIAPWIIRVLGPPVAAGVAAGTEAAGEVALGTAPAGTNPVAVGGTQAAYEVAGQAFWWPFRRVGSGMFASGIGKRAAAGLEAVAEDVRTGARTVKQTIQDRTREAIDATRMLTRALSEARPTGDVSAISAGARAGGAPRVAAALDKVVKQEMDAAAKLSKIERTIDNLVAQPPSRLGAGAVAGETLKGPTKRALDLAGARVTAAAADPDAPAIAWTPELSEALDDLVEQYRPAAVFGTATPEGVAAVAARRPPGFGSDLVTAVASTAQVGGRISREEFQQLLTKAKQTRNPYQLVGALGYLQRFKGESLPYDVAHAVKRALDDSINWDQRATTTIEGLTKHFRSTLRRSMAGFEPYDTATAAFKSLIDLHESDVGTRMIKLASEPDGAVRLADILKSGDAAQAQVVKGLLVDQAEAGGNPILGQRAWDSVRDVFTYDHVINGPIAGLSDRVRTLAAQNPEFARTVYNDVAGQKILSNLDALGQAYRQATARLAEVKAGRMGALDAAKRLDLRAAEQYARQQVKAVTALQDDLKASTVGAVQSFEQLISNAIRAVGLGLRSLWGALSIVRLLETASGPDLLRWAAYSPQHTQRIIQLLQHTGPERIAAGTARMAGTAAQQLNEGGTPPQPVRQSPTAPSAPAP